MSAPVFEKDLTGLLVVDPYNDFISEGGILWPLVKEIAKAVNCVPNMLAILQAARTAGIRVFFAPHHRDRGREDERVFRHDCSAMVRRDRASSLFPNRAKYSATLNAISLSSV